MLIRDIDHGIIEVATQLGGTSPLRDQIVYGLAEVLPFAVLLIAIILFFAGRDKRRRAINQETVLLGGAAVLLAFGIRVLLADAISRPRPFVTYPDLHHLAFPGTADYAFPSGHAVVLFTFAGVVWLIGRHRRLSWLLLGVAAVVVAARVVAGVHYATDVLVGAALGFLIARVVTWQSAWVKRGLK